MHRLGSKEDFSVAPLLYNDSTTDVYTIKYHLSSLQLGQNSITFQIMDSQSKLEGL